MVEDTDSTGLAYWPSLCKARKKSSEVAIPTAPLTRKNIPSVKTKYVILAS